MHTHAVTGPFGFWYKFVEINLTCVIVVETLRYLKKNNDIMKYGMLCEYFVVVFV